MIFRQSQKIIVISGAHKWKIILLCAILCIMSGGYMKKISFFLSFVLLFTCSLIFSQEQLLEKVNSMKRIAGNSVGRKNQISEEYQIFEQIEKLSTYEVVKLFQETNNSIGKVLCYWVLKERKYKNCFIYNEFLKTQYENTQIETQWYGELIENETLSKVINYNFRKLWTGKK